MDDLKRIARIILRNKNDFFLNSYQLSFLKKIVNAKYPLTKKQIDYLEDLKNQKIEKLLERIGKHESEINRLNELVRLLK